MCSVCQIEEHLVQLESKLEQKSNECEHYRQNWEEAATSECALSEGEGGDNTVAVMVRLFFFPSLCVFRGGQL